MGYKELGKAYWKRYAFSSSCIGELFMELTIEEQIKQCEDMLKNKGCDDNQCRKCQFENKECKNECFPDWKIVVKAKLKELRSENMDIKEKVDNIEREINKLNDILESVPNLKLELMDIREKLNNKEQKEQEKEVPFVVGGEYGTKNACAMLIQFDNDMYNLINSAGLVILSENITKKEMKERFIECNYKLKRTLIDLIKEKA
jgi:hypothetical protein